MLYDTLQIANLNFTNIVVTTKLVPPVSLLFGTAHVTIMIDIETPLCPNRCLLLAWERSC